MGFFYFDESIQAPAGFIIGAFVYSQTELTERVFEALSSAGLNPGVDEFKSGGRIDSRPELAKARESLRLLVERVRIGVIVSPSSARANLGNEALIALGKFLRANGIESLAHRVYIDEGITADSAAVAQFTQRVGPQCELYFNQDSRIVGGIQVADLVAHSLGIMLLEEQGFLNKTVKARRECRVRS